LFTTFARFNPCAKPDWRWTRACWLARHCARASERLDDLATRRTFHYLRCLTRCRDRRDRDEIRQDFPDLAAARQIHRENGNVRLELECRILASQNDEDIAEIMGLPVPVVKVYERVFFNVRPRLHAMDWIVISATGKKFVAETGEADIGVIARQFAYFGGPCMLKMVLPKLFDGSALSDSPLDLSKAADRSTMRLRLSVQAMTMPTDSKTSLEMLKLWPYFMPYLSPLPEALAWDGVLVEKVADLPESVMRSAVTRTSRQVRTAGEAALRGGATTLQSPEMAGELPSPLLAVSVA
jgi:hypothetical protein